jgi:tetratricopeptide (TPR) repeat protein
MLRSDDGVIGYIEEAEKAAVWVKLTEICYLFSHGLLRDAAYTMQMRARRYELHALAVEALETLFADDMSKRFAELAYHSEQANLREKTWQYCTLAGKEASSLYQNSLAADYFTRALKFAPFEDLAVRFDLLVERVEIFNRMGDRSSQLRDHESLDKLAKQLNDDKRAATVLMRYAGYHYFVGNYSESIEYAKRAEAHSESLGETELVLYTQVVWSVSLFRLGRLDEAMMHAQKTLERDRRAGNRKEISRILSTMGWIALDQNHPTAAYEYLLEALAIAREIRDPGLESRALNQLALLEGPVNGNYALAREYYETCYRLAREVGDRYMETGALGNMGFAAGMQGDFDSARSHHEQALILARETGDLNQEVFTLANLSAIAGIQNDANTALLHAERAKELAIKISERSGEAWAELYIGHACLMLNEAELAQSAYRRSIGIRQELQQLSLSMEPIAGLAESYFRENDLEAALHEIEKILGFFESESTLDGTDEPLRVYHTCYMVLEKKQDPRSRQVLQTAMGLLESQVSNFKDESARKRYIENIPWRRAIRDTAQQIPLD